MRTPRPEPEIKLRVVFGEQGMIGPGKAALLELIDQTGSIADAGRAMGMSYKRAWQLVKTMNALFSSPVVESNRGGAKGGGAVLTDTGRRVVEEYREMERRMRNAGSAQIARLHALVRDDEDSDEDLNRSD